VLYYADGDAASAYCGSCVPGESGLDGDVNCAVNQYCTDAAGCASVQDSAFWGESCPTEAGGLTTNGWCGPGLRCIEHTCVQCTPGQIDYEDGRVCHGGVWTYSPWLRILYEPEAVIPAASAALTVLALSWSAARTRKAARQVLARAGPADPFASAKKRQ
jgi:hypothetical protein